MLELHHIEKSFGTKKVLSDISMNIGQGIYGLVGLNGAGKTTLINVITGIVEPDAGKVLFEGKDIRHKKSEFKNKLGFMPQYNTFYPDYTAKEFLKYMCVMKEVPYKEQKERIAQVLEQVNLADSGNVKIGKFSGGMRQRVGIAQAMLNDPALLIMDEPTAGLDPLERIRFRKILETLSKDRTVILATHILSDVDRRADKVLLLHEGKVQVKDASENLVEELEEFFSLGEVEHV